MDAHLTWHRTRVQGRSASYGQAGEGPPLVFLHGWGLAHHAYKRGLKRLVRDLGLRVLAPALPGFGGTADLPGESFSMAGYGDWVADFLETVGVDEPVYLVGHSFGGGVAISTAHRHTDKVRFLVLVNSIGGSKWSAERKMRDRPLWDWGVHFPADMMAKGEYRRLLPVIFEDAVSNLVRNPRALWRVANLARRADLTEELADLKRQQVPLLALWGDHDRIITESAFRDLCLACGADGEVIDGSHSWLLSDPDAFGQVMTNVVQVAQVANRQAEKERRERLTDPASP